MLAIQGIFSLVSTYFYIEPLAEKVNFSIKNVVKSYIRTVCNARLEYYALMAGLCSSVTYCYSVVAPIVSERDFQLTSSEYGYWNIFSFAGSIAGCLSAPYLLKRFLLKIILGVFVCMIFVSAGLLIAVPIFSVGAISFFMIAFFLYCISSITYPAVTAHITEAIEDRASSAAMVSFIAMSLATLSAIIMNLLPMNKFDQFALTLTILLSFIVCFGIRMSYSKARGICLVG